MRTRMTELFGILHPIMCGGMLWLANPRLCAAISNAGGLGNLTAANYESAEELRKDIKETRQLTDKPFCVNITLLPSMRITKELHNEYFTVCCEERVSAVEISGVPLDKYLGPSAVEQAKKSDMKLIHKVGAVKHAQHAEHAGYDAVIAAGVEEGGHPLDDDVTTMLITPRMSEAVKIPVITTGGIADGRSLAAALVLGAEGVMMASRFIATEECLAHPKIKEDIIQRQENETVLICKTLNLQQRSLKNETARKVMEIEARHGSFEEIFPYLSGERTKKAWETGDMEGAPFAFGQSIGLIKDIVSCQVLIERMVREAEEILGKLQSKMQG